MLHSPSLYIQTNIFYDYPGPKNILSKCEMYLYDTNYLFSHLRFCGHDVWAFLNSIPCSLLISQLISFSWVLKNRLSTSYLTRRFCFNPFCSSGGVFWIPQPPLLTNKGNIAPPCLDFTRIKIGNYFIVLKKSFYCKWGKSWSSRARKDKPAV